MAVGKERSLLEKLFIATAIGSQATLPIIKEGLEAVTPHLVERGAVAGLFALGCIGIARLYSKTRRK